MVQDLEVDTPDLRSSAEYRALATQIREKSQHSPFDFYPSPGNWGDALINDGSRAFFNSESFQWKEYARADLESKETDKTPELAIIGGGGGWNRNWISTVSFTEELRKRYRNVIVLPSSYDKELTASIQRDNLTLFDRALPDEGSTDTFCHDMAFHCDIPNVDTQRLPYPLLAFRRDKERHPRASNPDRNWDISLLGTASTSSHGFFEIIGRFQEIYTDRLHIAIAGALLGRDVCLLDGNYGKNAGVYHGSLEEGFPNVKLISWQELEQLEIVGFAPIGVPGYTNGGVDD